MDVIEKLETNYVSENVKSKVRITMRLSGTGQQSASPVAGQPVTFNVIRKNGIKQMLLTGQPGWRFEQREQEMKTLTYRAS